MKPDPNACWTREGLDEEQKKLLPWTGQDFDLRVEIMDPKKGILLRRQPYRRVVTQTEGVYYIRDGRRYTEKGHLAEEEKNAKGRA